MYRDKGSNDDDDDGMGPRAFFIEGNNDEEDEDAPPTSAQEYLRRVQQEAKRCPDVVVADVDIGSFQKKQTVKINYTSGLHPAQKGFAPSLKWQQSQTAGFSQLRQKLARYKARRKREKLTASVFLPSIDDVTGWCRLCFGELHPIEQNTPGSPEGASGGGTLPLLSILCHMNQPTVIQVLEYHNNWFEATGFSSHQGRWFYALLACLEKPLTPEVCSLLRSLARNCANLRASLETKEDPRLVPLNLMICLVARYFDQTDLADNG